MSSKILNFFFDIVQGKDGGGYWIYLNCYSLGFFPRISRVKFHPIRHFLDDIYIYVYVKSRFHDDLKIQIEPGDEQTHSCKTANGTELKRRAREERKEASHLNGVLAAGLVDPSITPSEIRKTHKSTRSKMTHSRSQ